jgi:ribosome-associated toxin RatA of RatAB toxin-antitoxin module
MVAVAPVRSFESPGDWLSVTLPRSAERCYALFSDVERTPEWLPILRSATVTERDPRGRPQHVAFLCRLSRATVGYTLAYRFAPAERRVSWTTRPRASLRVRGTAHFQPLGAASCMVTYGLDLALGGGAPRFEDAAFSSHATSASLAEFRDFVLRQPS